MKVFSVICPYRISEENGIDRATGLYVTCKDFGECYKEGCPYYKGPGKCLKAENEFNQ